MWDKQQNGKVFGTHLPTPTGQKVLIFFLYVFDVKGVVLWQFCLFIVIWVAQLMLGPALDWTVGMLFLCEKIRQFSFAFEFKILTDSCLFSEKEELRQPMFSMLECVRNLYQLHLSFLKQFMWTPNLFLPPFYLLRGGYRRLSHIGSLVTWLVCNCVFRVGYEYVSLFF